MKYITKYFIAFKNENDKEKDKDIIFEKSKHQIETEKSNNLFDDNLIIEDIGNNKKKINLEFDNSDSKNELLNDLDDILKFENFFNDKILNRSISLSHFSNMGLIDIGKKNILSDIDEVLHNFKLDKEKKDIIEYNRISPSLCEEIIDLFEKHFENLIKDSDIHNKFNELKFNEFNDDRKDRFCRFCVVKKVFD
jgi:hypothetical protein